MTCERFEALASDCLDGAVTPGEEALLEAHLLLCSTCREMHHELSGLKSLLGGLDDEPLPGRQAEELWARIDQDDDRISGQLRRCLHRFGTGGSLLPSTALVAALLLMVVGVVLPFGAGHQEASMVVEEHLPPDALITVWESSAETIAASVGPLSIADWRLDEFGIDLAPVEIWTMETEIAGVPLAEPVSEVRIYYHGSINVQG